MPFGNNSSAVNGIIYEYRFVVCRCLNWNIAAPNHFTNFACLTIKSKPWTWFDVRKKIRRLVRPHITNVMFRFGSVPYFHSNRQWRKWRYGLRLFIQRGKTQARGMFSFLYLFPIMFLPWEDKTKVQKSKTIFHFFLALNGTTKNAENVLIFMHWWENIHKRFNFLDIRSLLRLNV